MSHDSPETANVLYGIARNLLRERDYGELLTNNLDMTIGSLGLSDHEEDQIVVFLRTLTDGFTRPYTNSDTFSGACMTGGSAATQGNGFLIPTPPLPPCAAGICDVAPVPGPMPIP